MSVWQVGFFSPLMRYDAAAQVVVVSRRDPDTGQVVYQTPSERTLRESRASHEVHESHESGDARTTVKPPSPNPAPTPEPAPRATTDARGEGPTAVLVSVMA